MQNLLDFLRKNASWFVFIILEIICFYLIFTGNSYQRSIFFNSSNEVSGRVYSMSEKVTSYFGLKEENESLHLRNLELEKQLLSMKNQLGIIESDSVKMDSIQASIFSKGSEYDLISAKVINNSVSHTQNFITINKGSTDGVKTDMGVVSQYGLVGIVTTVNNNFSVIQPILNPQSRIGCKVVNSGTFGTLAWEGGDSQYAYLKDYPKFEKFEKGDTIVTSGYSDMFPEGILAGIVEDFKSQANDNFYSLKVKLSTDFSALKYVILINKRTLEEQQELEKRAKNVKR